MRKGSAMTTAHAGRVRLTPAVSSSKPRRSFGAVVRDLLIEQDITTALGNPNWSAFSLQLGDDVKYESLRKAVAGERHPSPKIMESAAQALGVEPTVFWEYELWLVQRAFDPREVGEDQAYENLLAWQRKKGRGR